MNDALDENIGMMKLEIDERSRSFLKETAKWARFLAIVGFVMMGLMVLGGLFFGSTLAALSGAGAGAAMGGGVLMIVYVIVALIYFFPLLYLFKFATKMQQALKTDDQGVLIESFENMKSCFKFMGIFTIVILAFYALMLIIALIAGAAAGF